MGRRIGSLFSGAGGLDLAVQEVFGGDVVWHAEIDKAASKVLALRFPGVPNLGSVTDIDWATTVPPVDVICGGFPCTDVSLAGKRAGMHGTRSGLWSHMAEAIDVLRPRYVVIENVRGLLSANANRPMERAADDLGNGADRPVLRAIGAVLGDLADIGSYEARWVTVAAADVGAPHRRERVFLLAADTSGSRQHCGQPRAPIAGGSSRGLTNGGVSIEPACTGCGHLSHRHVQRRDSTPCGECGCGDYQLQDEPGVALLPTPRSSDCFGAGQHGDGGMDLRTTISLLPTPTVTDGSGGGVNAGADMAAHAGPNSDRTIGQKLRDLTKPMEHGRWGKYEPAIRRWESIAGPAPAPTEPNKNGNSRLSAAFSEWLMGWPQDWVTHPDIGISRNDQLRIIGNGVCPQQAIAALRFLLAVSEVTA